MSFVATAVGVSAVSGLAGNYMAGEAQKDAAKSQANIEQYMFDRASELNQPYMYAGNAFLNPLMQLYGVNPALATQTGQQAGVVGNATPEQQAAAMQMFYNSPEYTVQKNMLDQALMRQAAATGTRYSPSTALGQAEIAGRAFSDWRNNISGFANMGMSGANQQVSNLQALGGGLSQAAGNLGAARAGQYGAVGQTVSDLAGQFAGYQNYQNTMAQQRAMLQQPAQSSAFGDFMAGGGLPAYRIGF